MTALNDDDLGNLLKKLPRREASPEFTVRVMERLDDAAARATYVPRGWMFAGACAVLFGVWFGAVVVRERNERLERPSVSR